jgi:hypothetical protein
MGDAHQVLITRQARKIAGFLPPIITVCIIKPIMELTLNVSVIVEQL